MPACTRSGRWRASGSSATHRWRRPLARALNAVLAAATCASCRLPKTSPTISMRASAPPARPTGTASSTAPFASPFVRRYVWHVMPRAGRRRRCARPRQSLVGTHDFAAFQGTGTGVPYARCGRSARLEWRGAGRLGVLVMRSRGRRLPPAHGAQHRGHAGRDRARTLASRRRWPDPRVDGSRARRDDGAAAGLVSG